ncbi:MAG TPA: hypothetical protein VJQ55_13180, partial [Candidatus Binatia bacterium]|nr:hypothetical protein [Candidatus Binatia bacterium]
MNDRIKRLQQEAEAIRQEGFVAGWDAAMETILKATRAAPPEDNFDTPQPRGGARNPNIMPRGATPLVVSRVLRSVTPRALSPTQIIALAEES